MSYIKYPIVLGLVELFIVVMLYSVVIFSTSEVMLHHSHQTIQVNL